MQSGRSWANPAQRRLLLQPHPVSRPAPSSLPHPPPPAPCRVPPTSCHSRLPDKPRATIKARSKGMAACRGGRLKRRDSIPQNLARRCCRGLTETVGGAYRHPSTITPCCHFHCQRHSHLGSFHLARGSRSRREAKTFSLCKKKKEKKQKRYFYFFLH